MFRKLIVTLLCITILFSFSIPTFAATVPDATPNRTVEEILNEYHEKAFFSLNSSGTGSQSVYSCQITPSDQTLEQETVDALVAAGYEAYNVSSSNYDALEKALQTDFEHLGMNPNGSFIIVIHSDDYTTDSNNTDIATSRFDPSTPELDDGEFYYSYNGHSYTMRYFTVTSATNPNLVSNGSVYLLQNETITSANLSILENILNTGIYCVIDGVIHAPVSTFGGALGISIVDFQEVYNAIFYVDAVAKWTRTYTQIKDPDYGTWSSYSSVDYVTTDLEYRGSYYDPEIQDYTSHYRQYCIYEYSNHYTDYSWRKQQAAASYEFGFHGHEYVGDVKVYKDPLDSSSTHVLTLYQLKLG